MTKSLYWAKPYQKTFTGTVLDVKNGAIILDKTLFYATAGNQIHDTGTITIEKKIFQVNNVEKDESDTYFHYTDPKPTQVIIGSTIKGEIDWERRYLVMKAHTAQHIVSAIMVKQFNNKTIHANIKPGEFSIEFEQKITREQLGSVMKECNQIFTIEEKKVNSHVLDHNSATKKYSTKIRGIIPQVEEVRILEVSGVDFNTCGGTHVKKSSEIGIVCVINIHRESEVSFLCAEKAIELLSSCNTDVIFSLIPLNCTLEEFPIVFEKKINELQDLQKNQKDLSVLIVELLQYSPYEEINGIKTRFVDVNLPKKAVFNGFKKFEPDNVLTVKQNSTQFLILSSSKNFPANMIVEKLKSIHGGKGGGSPLNAQILFDKEPNEIQKDIIHILSI
ncbi:MAG: hypothetical protein EU530_10165 [Promethearchaeota archaeon]|nr:MAG: hypothetical protein EU530_10165 [Candidatus Lokiarchaeota archaeon]